MLKTEFGQWTMVVSKPERGINYLVWISAQGAHR